MLPETLSVAGAAVVMIWCAACAIVQIPLMEEENGAETARDCGPRFPSSTVPRFDTEATAVTGRFWAITFEIVTNPPLLVGAGA